MNVKASILMVGCAASFAATLAAQPVTVSGTGDPNRDVAAVQAAVDQGGSVVLMGNFSFDRPPTAPAGSVYNRMVTVSKEVTISGNRDADGKLPVIQGGDWPFLVDAGSSHVTIQGLHFVQPSSGAIWVYSAGGLLIKGCQIENVQATVEFAMQAGQGVPVSSAIFVGANPHPPNAANPGTPENFSGTLAVVNNDIAVGAMPGAENLGIVMFSVGRTPDKEVNVLVSGNNIRNLTEPGINFRVIGGRVYAERNVVITGSVLGGAANPDAIRVVGSGSYVIAHNTVDCGWTDGAAAGINVIGQPPPMVPAASVTIVDNDVTMSVPEGTVFGPNSAGIEMRGFVQGTSVLNNTIRGRANAALVMLDQNAGMPARNSLLLNNLVDFQSSLADIVIDAGVTNTFVLGRQASMKDNGTGTVVMPMR